MKDKNRILIINLGGIGDLLLSTPALKALRVKFPEACIDLLIFQQVNEYAQGLPFIDNIFTLSSGKKDFFKNLSTLFFIRKKRIDTALNMRTLVSSRGAFKIKLLIKLINAAKTIGRDTSGRGYFFDIKIPEPDVGEKFELEYDIESVNQLGVDVRDKGIVFDIDARKRKETEELLKNAGIRQEDRIIAVHPGGKPSHRWAQENFANILKMLNQDIHAKIVIVGSADEKSLAEYISKKSGLNIFDLCGKMDIYQLGALLKRADILICNDSAPMHIAAAIGTPLVAIFGAGYFNRFNPENISDKAIALYKKAKCSPCGKIECADMRCLKAISVDDVYNAAVKLLKG